MATYIIAPRNELYHYGIKGMKWGKRKARGPSVLGSRIKSAGYTLAAKNYGLNERTYSKMKSSQAKTIAGMNRTAKNDAYKKAAQYRAQADQLKAQKNSPEAVAARKAKAKKAVKIGAAVAGTALAAYGAYKASEVIKNKAYKKAYERGRKANLDYLKKYNEGALAEAFATGNKKNVIDASRRVDNLSTRLIEDNADYARRHSKNLVESVKTLRGKNREFTSAELLNQGITPWRYTDDDLLYKRRRG